MRKKAVGALIRKRGKYGYFFTAPFIIGAACFILMPVVMSILFSFSQVQPTVEGFQLHFTGLQNYRYLFLEDPEFTRTLTETVLEMAKNVPVVVIFSFFIASLLNQKFHGRTLVRAILFLPLIVSSGLVMQMKSGVVAGELVSGKGSETVAVDFAAAFSESLSQFKMGPSFISLLVSAINNISTILAMSAIPIIIFLAGLQSISTSIYEASYVEGATAWEVFWKISLPMISPLILVTILYCVVDSFTSVTNTMITSIRSVCFTDFSFGIGSAMTWVYLFVVAVLMLMVFAVINRFVFYQN